jgi:formylglycine-generating enzyme required for sulfatase activity
MSRGFAGRCAAVLCTVACIMITSVVAAEERPTERVSPAPKVNGNAVVWRTSVPPVSPQGGDLWVNPENGMEMVYVPAGKFLMGSPEGDKDALPNECPQRRVYLDGYWIDRNLVTVAQYRKFCQATGREMPPAPSWGWKEDHPIVNVTWDDAAAYAAWAGKRLPTEAEWEKAARGTDGRQYPWGNEWDPSMCANSVGHSLSGTQPVGSYLLGASPYGALDMAGNVYEWCADWYDEKYYQSAPARNPTGPASGTLRVLRGGAWIGDGPRSFRCAYRIGPCPACWDLIGGFRCARGYA